MSDLQDVATLVSASNTLIDDIRGGAILQMKNDHSSQKAEFANSHTAQLAEFSQQHSAQMQLHDNAIAQRKTAADSVLSDLRSNVYMREHFYDSALITKNSLNIVADTTDETMSEWQQVPVSATGYVNYSSPSALTMLHLTRCYSYSGGYPDFATDTSRTAMQFVLTNESANSADINTAIAEQSLELNAVGEWNYNAKSVEIPAISIAGEHPYLSLWVRFVNIPARQGDSAQNVTQFGGDAVFAVNRVVNYYKIAK